MLSPLLRGAFLGAFIGFLNQSELDISSQDLAHLCALTSTRMHQVYFGKDVIGVKSDVSKYE